MSLAVKEPIPPYLMQTKDLQAVHYYGKLYYEKRTDSWIIRAEPYVVQMAKRLFPGSSGRQTGEARFPRNKRTIGELNWFMLRYPLEIVDEDRWKKDYEMAVQHVVKRNQINQKPQKMEPPKMVFNGTLREYQKEALAFMRHNAPTLLVDDVGLGKTVEALAWIADINRYPGIIVCPNNVVRQWANMIRQFIRSEVAVGQQKLFNDQADGMVHIIKGLTPYELPEANFYVIHYGLLRGWKQYLPYCNFKFLVFDEIQELRRKQSEKYSAASLLAQSIEDDNRIGMSATPIYNAGGEIWNILNIIEMHALGDWDSFTREWCRGYGSDEVKDPQMLGQHLRREGLMLRRTRNDVNEQLPRSDRVIQEIDRDESILSQGIKEAMKIIGKMDLLEDQRQKRKLINDVDRIMRKSTGLAKAPYVAAFVKMLVEAGEPVLLYGWHHDVYESWLNELKEYRPVKITGKETDTQKEENKQKFIRGETDILILSLRTAAGLDGLQKRARISVFGELDWSPGVHKQCEGRLERDGQLQAMLHYYLVSGPSDEIMLDYLGFKSSQFKGIMGERPETEEEKALAQLKAGKHIERIIQALKEKKAAS